MPAFVAKIKEYAEELDCVIEEIAGLAIYALADKYSEEGEILNPPDFGNIHNLSIVISHK